MNEYENALARLRGYTVQNEIERRRWANEIWSHEDGRIYKICRVLCPILSVLGVLATVFYALIRDAQMFLQNTGGLSYDAQETNTHFIAAAVYSVLIVLSNTLMFMKKRKIGEIIAIISGVAVSVYLLTQINIAMPNNRYKILLLCIILSNILLIISAGTMRIFEFRDKRDYNRSFDNILTKITQGNGLTDESEYPRLIDEFLTANAQKTVEQKRKKFRKQSKS